MDFTTNTSNYSRKRQLAIIPELSQIQQQNTNVSSKVLAKRARVMPEVAGKILCIELKNFMCHSSLKLNFDITQYNCSYIVGPNGSGKSALFASLNIGLGGSGRLSERGKTVQSYIKEGCDHARIRIHLSNEGPNALCDYNEVIIIERLITEKTTNFIIKTRTKNGAREEVKAKNRTRHELEIILQQFNIELDNPLSWLSQDRSRQFLQSMKPEKLYELYRKSSEIDGTENLFRNIDAHFEELTKIMESMDKEKHAKEQKYQNMKTRYEAISKLKDLKTTINRYYWYKLWAPVRDKQKEILEVEEKLDENKRKNNEAKKSKDELIEKVAEINRQQNNSEQERVNALEKCHAHEEKVVEHKKKIREIDFELHDLEGSIKHKELNIRGMTDEITKARQTLTELMGNSNRDIETEKKELLKRRNEIADRIQTIQRDCQKHDNELRVVDNEYQTQKRLLQAKMTEFSQLENQKVRVTEEKNLFERSKTDEMALYGAEIPTIIQLINSNSHLFGKLPLGPVGKFIKLKELKWADPVEYVLRGHLGTFLCNSAEDRRVFDQICTTKRIKTPVLITTTFSEHKFDISAQESPREFTTIMRVLDIKDSNIYNYILDRAQIDTILLVEQDSVARELMYPNPPIHVNKAVTLACSEINPQRGRRAYQYFSGNGQFHSRVFANNFMVKNLNDFFIQLKKIEECIRTKNNDIQKLKLDVQTKERNTAVLRTNLHECNRKLHGFNEQRYSIDEELQKLEDLIFNGDKITNLRSSLCELEINHQRCLEQLNTILKQQADKKEKNVELQSKWRAYNDRLAFLKNDINQIQYDINSCQIQMTKIQEQITKLNDSIEKAERLTIKYTDEIDKNKRIYEQLRKEAESAHKEFLQEALSSRNLELGQGSPNFDQIPETKELDRIIKQMESEIKANEPNNMEPPSTPNDLIKYKDDYVDFKKKVKIWKGRIEILEKLINNRKKKFDLLRISLPGKIQNHFKDHMFVRRYKAYLDFDDNRNTITIKVETHKIDDNEFIDNEGPHQNGQRTRKRKVIQDLRGLSGGERSFTTACFVMALWDCLESPFRCLDEFDVFMDMVNRRTVMEMLIEKAKNKKEVQFIFFTPQSIQELRRDEIEVFTLKKIAGIFENETEENNQI